MSSLITTRFNTYSQHGEDGIIAEILMRLKFENENRWAVEFGAWDGKHLSNTFRLVQEFGWNAVFIEGDLEKYNDLIPTVQEYPSIVPIMAYVDQYAGMPNCLDSLLAQTPCPQDIDVLSIDIDSYDSDVWESLANYTAKIVIIETNTSAGPDIVWRHEDPPPGQISRGSSFWAIQEIAQAKGYTLVCYTGNSIYVRNDFIDKLDLPKEFIENPKALFHIR